TGYIPSPVVHQTLQLSGFTRVAAFGPLITAASTAPQLIPQAQGLLPSYPAVEIFAASQGAPASQGAAGGSGTPSPVAALPSGQTVYVNGGPDSLLQLAGQGLLSSGQPAIISGDTLPVPPASWAVTDGQRRADNTFSLINSNVSYTYTATEKNPPSDQFGAP